MLGSLKRSLIMKLPASFLELIMTVKRHTSTPVLLYHEIRSTTNNSMVSENIHRVNPDIFSQQIELLRRHFTIVPLDELVAGTYEGCSTSGLAALTFDDGYLSVLNEALPILREMDIPCTIFISSAVIRNRAFWRDKIRWIISNNLAGDFIEYGRSVNRSFWLLHSETIYRDSKNPSVISSRLVDELLDAFLDEVRAKESVRRLGRVTYCSKTDISATNSPLVAFGNHTANHYVLSSLSEQEQYNEIAGCHGFLKALGKEPSKVFSIPFGGNRDFNDTTLRILKDLGYTAYLLSENRINVRNGVLAEEVSPCPVAVDRFMPNNGMNGFILQLLRLGRNRACTPRTGPVISRESA